jgi:hypothetical protein
VLSSNFCCLTPYLRGRVKAAGSATAAGFAAANFCCSCPSAPDLLVPSSLLLLLLLLDIEVLTMKLWESLCQVIQKETGRYGDGILEAGQEFRCWGPIQGGMLHDLPEVPELGHAPKLLPDAGGYALMILLQSVSFSLRYVRRQDDL